MDQWLVPNRKPFSKIHTLFLTFLQQVTRKHIAALLEEATKLFFHLHSSIRKLLRDRALEETYRYRNVVLTSMRSMLCKKST